MPPLPSGEPLPPGVDICESDMNGANEPKVTNDSLSLVVDSFYSDIAAIEANTQPQNSTGPPSNELPKSPGISQETNEQVVKKKKKVSYLYLLNN